MSDTSMSDESPRDGIFNGVHLMGAPIHDLQQRQERWADAQGWERGDGTLAFLGMIEELGEMADVVGYPAYSDHDLVKTIMLMQDLGKYAHATLKRLQGIRGTAEEHQLEADEATDGMLTILRMDDDADIKEAFDEFVAHGQMTDVTDEMKLIDGFGDLFIYALDVANRKGFDAQRAIEATCEQVFKRDWVRHPIDGIAS